MEKFATKREIEYNFTKKERGKFLADVTKQVFKNLGKNYKMPKGYRTEFIDFKDSSTANVFGDEKTKKIYFSLNAFLNKENFSNDLYNTTKEFRRLCEYKGRYDENNKIDKQSQTFSNSTDLKNMIVTEKSGSKTKNNITEQIEKDVEFFMLGKNFLSPREKNSRKFALDFMKKMLESLSNEGAPSDIIENIKEFIRKKEFEETQKEQYYSNFINNIEKDIIDTIEVSQQRLGEAIKSLNNDRVIRQFEIDNGYNPIKASAQSLSINYNDRLARNLFSTCTNMEINNDNDSKYLLTCLDLIKYTDFIPTQQQVHSLNQSSKLFNSLCSNNEQKIHPKKMLKDFFNIRNDKSKDAQKSYQQEQRVNVN